MVNVCLYFENISLTPFSGHFLPSTNTFESTNVLGTVENMRKQERELQLPDPHDGTAKMSHSRQRKGPPTGREWTVGTGCTISKGKMVLVTWRSWKDPQKTQQCQCSWKEEGVSREQRGQSHAQWMEKSMIESHEAVGGSVLQRERDSGGGTGLNCCCQKRYVCILTSSTYLGKGSLET